MAALLLLGGCAGPPACRPALVAELLFGAADQPGFEAFLDRSVTPRFPAGLTVTEAEGRWRAPDGHQVRERSRRVLLVLPPRPDPLPALEAVRAEYRHNFQQQSVGLVLTRGCASF